MISSLIGIPMRSLTAPRFWLARFGCSTSILRWCTILLQMNRLRSRTLYLLVAVLSLTNSIHPAPRCHTSVSKMHHRLRMQSSTTKFVATSRTSTNYKSSRASLSSTSPCFSFFENRSVWIDRFVQTRVEDQLLPTDQSSPVFPPNSGLPSGSRVSAEAVWDVHHHWFVCYAFFGRVSSHCNPRRERVSRFPPPVP
jgi:hypothetical protein